jgi:choice-of-anchor B domain-containing protein
MTRMSVVLVSSLLLGSAGASAQTFGGPLAISGDQVLVGESGNRTLPGIVYLFERSGGSWEEQAQMMASGDVKGAPDGFGSAIAANNATMLVGAPLDSEGAGGVYVYSKTNNQWDRTGHLMAPGMNSEMGFGSSVVLDGSVAYIGASGGAAVFVYRRASSGSWEMEREIRSSEAEAGTGFGAKVATDGNVMLVTTAASRRAPGAVYSFRRQMSGEWTETGELTAEGLGERNGFGSSIAVKGGRAFVGAPGANQRTGAVVAFDYDTETSAWMAADQLGPFVSGGNAQFGASISFDGSDTWIGSPGDNQGTGSFYVYSQDDSGDWTGVNKLASSSGVEGAAFGTTAAISGDVAVVGAAGVDSRAGAAIMLERDGADWSEHDMVVNDLRGYDAINGDEVVCTDNEASAFECNEVNIVSFVPIKDMGGARGVRINDVWGWTDSETGREYAIVGRTDGVSFVDMTDAANPKYLGDLPKTEGSRNSIWRDMKVYKDHAYVVADAADQHGLQVLDLRQFRTLGETPVTFEPTFTYDGIASAHNIVINEQTGFAYSVGSSSGGETCGGGLHMISLENPSEPTFAGCFADPTTGRRQTGYSHDAQCVVYNGPDAEHRGKEICLGSNETALNIADVTDKENPVTISTISYPNVAYTHQGWLTEDHSFFYQGDEGDEPQGTVAGTRTLVWDLTDLDDPVLFKEYFATTTDTDHNLYVRGNIMYQSNYGAGLRVLDVSDPGNPVEIGFFDTTPHGGMGSWSNFPYFQSGLVIATSGSEGLFILKSTARPGLVP